MAPAQSNKKYGVSIASVIKRKLQESGRHIGDIKFLNWMLRPSPISVLAVLIPI